MAARQEHWPGELRAEMSDAIRCERDAAREELIRRLQSGKKVEQVLAAEELAAFGAEAVPPLCAALSAADDDVRIAAARSLGALGDPRAIEPLIGALRGRCVGGSGKKHRRAGYIFFGVVAGVLVGVPLLSLLAMGKTSAGFVGGLVGPTITWCLQRGVRGKVLRAISRSLEQITTAHPRPEVRDVLSDLDALAADALQQDRETRDTLRQALRHIDALTENLRSLPIAAMAPEPEISTLPAPAHPGASDPDVLPRISA